MKKIIFTPLLPILLALTSFVFSQQLERLIPKNADFVFTINNESLQKKYSIDSIKTLDFYKNFQEAMKKSTKDAEVFEEFEKIFFQPHLIGIDAYSKAYIFYNINSERDARFTFLLPLTDGKLFTSFLNNTIKWQEKKIQKKGKLNYLRTGEVYMIWSQNYLYMTSASTYRKKSPSKQQINKNIKEFTKVKKKKSMVSSPVFLKSQQGEFDFCYLFNHANFFEDIDLEKLLNDPDNKDPFFTKDMFKDTYEYTHLNFKNGGIVYETDQHFSTEISDKIRDIINIKPNPELLGLLPDKKPLGFVSMAINIPELKKSYYKYFEQHDSTIQKSIVKEIYKDSFEKDSIVFRTYRIIDSLNNIRYPAYDYSNNYYLQDTTSTYDDTNYNNYNDGTIQFDTEYLDAAPADTTVILDNYEEEISEEEYHYEDTDSIMAEPYNEDYYYEDDYAYDTLDAMIDSLYTVMRDRKEVLINEKYLLTKQYLTDSWDYFIGDFVFVVTDIKRVEKMKKVFEFDDNFNKIEKDTTTKYPMPVFQALFSINNEEKIKQALSFLKEKGLVKEEQGYYKVIPGDEDIFLTIKNKILVCTNDSLILNQPIKKVAAVNSDLEKLLSEHNSSLYINLNELFGRIGDQDMSAKVTSNFKILEEIFQDIQSQATYDGKQNTNSEFSINLNNKERNAIYELFKLINELYLVNVPQR